MVKERHSGEVFRRRFLTPAVSLGQMATGEQVLSYVEKVNALVLFVCGAIGVFVCGFVWGGVQSLGVLCGVVVVGVLSGVMWLLVRYTALSRLEAFAVQLLGYVVKFGVLFAALFVAKQVAPFDVRFMAVSVLVGLLLHLVIATLVIVRTPVALDVVPR